jgi:hypothetical protein
VGREFIGGGWDQGSQERRDRGGLLSPFWEGLDLTAGVCAEKAHDPCAQLWLVRSEEVRIGDVALEASSLVPCPSQGRRVFQSRQVGQPRVQVNVSINS